MSKIGAPSLFSINPDTFFDRKSLNAASTAALETRINAAKSTLVLADRLQGARDNQRALWKMEDSMRTGNTVGSGLSRKILDINL